VIVGLVVVVAGMASLALEMGAARLLAPFFGSSLYTWAILIGLILVYLTAGYWLGGRLADRRPSHTAFFTLNLLAAAMVALAGAVATPVLAGALRGTAGLPFGLFFGAIAGCLALFAAPMILLGCVSPYAIRLSVDRVANAGHASGTVFALTTIGSLLGTFSAVFICIPNWGTRATIYVFAGLLLAATGAGWLVNQATKTNLES
jgi:MFS family permease